MAGVTKKDVDHEFDSKTLGVAAQALSQRGRNMIAADYKARKRGEDVDITHVDVSLALNAVGLEFGDEHADVMADLRDARV